MVNTKGIIRKGLTILLAGLALGYVADRGRTTTNRYYETIPGSEEACEEVEYKKVEGRLLRENFTSIITYNPITNTEITYMDKNGDGTLDTIKKETLREKEIFSRRNKARRGSH